MEVLGEEERTESSINDLCPEDKRRVRGLIEQVAHLGSENRRLEGEILKERDMSQELLENLKTRNHLLEEKRELHPSILPLHCLGKCTHQLSHDTRVISSTAPPISHAHHVTSLPAHSQSCEYHESDHMTKLPKQPLQRNFTKDSPFPSHQRHPTSYMPGQSFERCVRNHMTTLPRQPPKGHCTKNMQSPSHEHHPSSNMTSLPTQHSLLPRTEKRSMHHSSRNSMDMHFSPIMHFSDKEIFKIKSPTGVAIHLPNFNSLHPCITTCNPNRASTSHTKTAGSFTSTHQQTALCNPFQTSTSFSFPTLRSISLSSDSTSIIPSSIYLTANTSPSGDQAKSEQIRASLKVGKEPSPKMNAQVRQPSSGREGCSLIEQNRKQNKSSEITATLEPLPQSVVDNSLLVEEEPKDPELVPMDVTCKASVVVDSCTQTFNVESKAIQTECEMLVPAVCEGEVESRICKTCRKCKVEASMPSVLAEGACASVRRNDESGDGCGAGRITISRADLRPPLEKSKDSTLSLHDCLPSAITYSTDTCTEGGEKSHHNHTHPNKLTQTPVTIDAVNIGPDTLFASSLLNADSFTHGLHRHRSSSSELVSSERFYPGQGEYDDASLDRLDGGGVKMSRLSSSLDLAFSLNQVHPAEDKRALGTIQTRSFRDTSLPVWEEEDLVVSLNKHLDDQILLTPTKMRQFQDTYSVLQHGSTSHDRERRSGEVTARFSLHSMNSSHAWKELTTPKRASRADDLISNLFFIETTWDETALQQL